MTKPFPKTLFNTSDPYVKFPINGTEYTLYANIEVIEELEHSFRVPLGQLVEKSLAMTTGELTNVIEIGISGTADTPPMSDDIGQAILDYGYGETCWLILEFLALAVSPTHKREKTREKLKSAFKEAQKIKL